MTQVEDRCVMKADAEDIPKLFLAVHVHFPKCRGVIIKNAVVLPFPNATGFGITVEPLGDSNVQMMVELEF